MGQKKPREKTRDELQAERVTAALEETDRTGHAPAEVRDNPGVFLRNFYEVWHRQGGMEGGRPRNSIRKMREQWLTGRNHVPSLHPKLMGRVKLTRSDARALIDLFLTRWRYLENGHAISSTTIDGYAAFQTRNRVLLCKNLLNSLMLISKDNKNNSIELPLKEKKLRNHGDDVQIQSFVEDDYNFCDAIITFSKNKIAIGPNPPQVMKNFFYLMDAFYEKEKDKKSSCIFIWIVDLGLRIFEDDESFRNFYNAGLLFLMFQALLNFDSERDDKDSHGHLFRRFRIMSPLNRENRWNWLNERSVVVVDNLRSEEFQNLYGEEEDQIKKIRLKDAGINTQNILPSEIPNNWLVDIRKFFGRKIDINNVSFTSLYNKKGWNYNNDTHRTNKFYAHARTITDSGQDDPNIIVESVELPSPGRKYDEALQMIYLASRYRIRGDLSLDSEEATAFAYLRKLGFHVLRIDDFVRIFSSSLQH